MKNFNPIDPFDEEIWIPPTTFYSWLEEHYTKDMWHRITSLNCSGQNIINLIGIEKLPNLKVFDCSNNRLKSFAEMSSSREIQILNISNNEINNIGPITYMKKLKRLYCYGNSFSDNYINAIKSHCFKNAIIVEI